MRCATNQHLLIEYFGSQVIDLDVGNQKVINSLPVGGHRCWLHWLQYNTLVFSFKNGWTRNTLVRQSSQSLFLDVESNPNTVNSAIHVPVKPKICLIVEHDLSGKNKIKVRFPHRTQIREVIADDF